MRRGPAQLIISGILLLGLLSAARAAKGARPDPPQRAAMARAAAEKEARAGHWILASAELAAGRKALETGIRALLGPAPGVEADPEYQKGAAALRAALLKKIRGAKDRKKLTGEFQAYRQQIEALAARVRAKQKPGAEAEANRARARKRAQWQILLAGLDDQDAAYLERAKKPADAAAARWRAASARLEAYQALQQEPQAGQAAEALLKRFPNDPAAAEQAASYFQVRKQYDRALAVWQGAIRSVEAGAPRRVMGQAIALRESERKSLLPRYYRQTAFCLDRLGRAEEAKAAIRKADAIR